MEGFGDEAKSDKSDTSDMSEQWTKALFERDNKKNASLKKKIEKDAILADWETRKSVKALAKRMKKLMTNSWAIHGYSCEKKKHIIII